MDGPKQTQVCINGRTVDFRRGSVTDASGQALTLRPQVALVLKILADRAGVLVTKDELMEAVWPGIAVTDDSLVQCIKDVRKAVGDDQHDIVVTLVKRGYMLEANALRPFTMPAADPSTTDRERSIAVLPFANLSTDSEQEFFVDGLTEDLIIALSKVPELFVIARYTSFAFKGKAGDVRRVAEDLGVHYVLEGSARRAAGRIRINAQLIDARDGGGHLWGEKFDRDLTDVFAVQDEVVADIVDVLFGKLAAIRLPDRKPPKSLEAYDLCVRGRFLYQRMTDDEGREARQLFQRAVELDPEYAEAHAYLAWTHWLGWVNWFEPTDPHRQLALDHAQRAVALDPNDPFAHSVLAYVLEYERKYEEAAAQIDAALRVDPNHADTYAMRTDLLVMEGKPLEASQSMARALRLNPRPPAWYYWLQGEAEYAARQYEKAIATLCRESTYGTPSRSILAAALAQLGRIEEARTEGRLFMADYPSFRIGSFLDTQPFRNLSDREHFAVGYRKAALPE